MKDRKVGECQECGRLYFLEIKRAELLCKCGEEMRFFPLPDGYLILKRKDEEYLDAKEGV